MVKTTDTGHRLCSPWGQGNTEKSEYPRPQMVRGDGQCRILNGEWQFTICNDQQYQKERQWEHVIRVPFSPETILSGIEQIPTPEEYLHYRKVIDLEAIPEGYGLLLHFGAVDQECTVYVNGKKTATHKGGYLAFTLDITSYVQEGENELVVIARDRTELAPYARGKQRWINAGPLQAIFYPGQSGIWKTVWLEQVPEVYIREVRITPAIDLQSITMRVEVGRIRHRGIEKDKENQKTMPQTYSYQVSVPDSVENVSEKVLACGHGMSGTAMEVGMNKLSRWTPDTPILYPVEIRMGTDRVTTYFGMRSVSVGRDRRGIARIELNHDPYFVNGVLDQAYWPESLMTAPSDAAMIDDILRIKALGFNTIRMHVKVEEERFYYHCDRLGMLVVQDMPNGGGDYNMYFQAHLPNIGGDLVRGISDANRQLFRREDAEGRKQFLGELKQMICQLRNHPSIIMWVPFNEGWGQFEAAKVSRAVKRMDPTRLVNEACGWFDQGGGDLFSIHNYYRKLKVQPQGDRVVALTECGGFAYPVKDHVYSEKAFGYRKYRDREELTANYVRLWREQLIPCIRTGLSMVIYTQFSDLCEEVNGFVTFDRVVDKMDQDQVRQIHRQAQTEWDVTMKEELEV